MHFAARPEQRAAMAAYPVFHRGVHDAEKLNEHIPKEAVETLARDQSEVLVAGGSSLHGEAVPPDVRVLQWDQASASSSDEV
jgi:hypothetical protein